MVSRSIPVLLMVALVTQSGVAHARDWFDHHPRSLAVAADGVTIAAACADRFVRIWNSSNGQLIQKIALEHPGRSIAFFGREGDFAVGDSGGTESTVTIWKKQNGKYTRTSRTKVLGMVAAMSSSPDGKWIVAVTVYGHICFLGTAQGTLHRVWQESGNGIHDLAFSSDGKTLYTAGQAFRAWDVRIDELAGETATMRHFIPDDEREKAEKKYLRFQTGNATAVSPLPGQDRVIAVGWFFNSKGTSSDLTLFEGPKGEKKTKLSDAMGDATFITVSPDGKKLLIGKNNDRLELWDVRAGRKAEIQRAGIGMLRAGVFLGEGNHAAITNDDTKRVEVIDVRSGKLIKAMDWSIGTPP